MNPNTLNKQHDWRDDRTQATARAALAKAGVKLRSEKPDASRSDLLDDRNEMRRTINDMRERAITAADRGDHKEVLSLSDEIDAVGAFLARAQTHLDLQDLTAQHKSKAGGDTWGRQGTEVSVLAKGDSFAKAVRADQSPGFGFGEYVGAMVRGTDRQDIRAALSEGSDSAGGYTVPKYLLAELIDRMRAKTSVVQAGARTVPLATEKTTIARLASDPTAAWRLESSAIAESSPTFEAATFTARSLACLVKVSWELLGDSVNIDTALMQAFAGAMAVEVDRVCLFGSGVAPEPLGVNGSTGVGIVSMGTNGAQLTTWGKVLDTVLEIKQDNAEDPTGMIMSPRTWRTVEGFVDSTGQPLRPSPAIERIPRFVSNNVGNTMTQGSANNASAIVVGDFSQMLLGVRSELRIEVLRETFAVNGQYAFIAHLRFDMQLAHPESFAVLRGIIP